MGILGLVRMLPATVTGTFAGVPAARFGSGRVLVAANILRSLGAVWCAVGVWLGAPTAVVFIGAAVVASAGVMVRPVQSALLPSLAKLPEELVAANVVSSLGEAVGTIIGPLLGGILVASVSQSAAMAVAAVLFVGATISVAGLDASEDRGAPVRAGEAAIERPSMIGTFRTVAGRPGPALVIVDFVTQSLVRGMLVALIVVTSLELLDLGDAGIGWLNAAVGLGGLIGAVGAASLGGNVRLSRVFALSLAMWGLPIAVIGAWPVALVAIGAMIVTGLSNATLDIAGFTILQRSFPPRERLAAFGLLEGLAGLAVALGGIVASLLLDRFGILGTLALTGALLPIMAVATWPWISRLEVESLVPEGRLDLPSPRAVVRSAEPVDDRTARELHGPDRDGHRRGPDARRRGGRSVPRHRDRFGGRLGSGSPSADVRSRRGDRRDRPAARRAADGDRGRDGTDPGAGTGRAFVQGRDGRAGRLGRGRGDHRRPARRLGSVSSGRRRLTPQAPASRSSTRPSPSRRRTSASSSAS